MTLMPVPSAESQAHHVIAEHHAHVLGTAAVTEFTQDMYDPVTMLT